MYCLHISYLYLHITVGDPEVNRGGGGGLRAEWGKVREGYPILMVGVQEVPPERMLKKWSKTVQSGVQIKPMNQFKLRCFSSKITQNIFIYCQEIPLILLHCQWRMDPEEGIVNQSRCKTVVGVCEGISLYIKRVRPLPNLAERVSFFFLWHFKFLGGHKCADVEGTWNLKFLLYIYRGWCATVFFPLEGGERLLAR